MTGFVLFISVKNTATTVKELKSIKLKSFRKGIVENMIDKKIIEAAKACIEYTEQHKGVTSFVNLERIMQEHQIPLNSEETHGHGVAYDGQYPTILAWIFESKTAFEVWDTMLKLLEEEGRGVAAQGTTPFVYLADGKMPTLPLAKSFRNYQKSRWLPVTLSIQDNK